MKTIKNGLTLYPLREDKEHQSIKDIGLLPKVYSVFVNMYKLGQNQVMNSEVYLDERYNEKLSVARLKFTPNSEFITLGSLYSLEESTEIESRIFDDDFADQKNVRLIGEDATGHYFFMVGTGSENSDIIYLESSDLSFPGGERLTKISNNIFEFMSLFQLVEIEDGIGYGVEYDQLYKRWGEDFWRVRKSE